MQDFFSRSVGREEIKDILYTNAQQSDARSPAALLRIDCDAMQLAQFSGLSRR
jgi:hypothetical protein